MYRLLFFSLMLSLSAFASELEGELRFNGQNAETIRLSKTVTVQRPVEREVPGTCQRPLTREVPGTCVRQIPKQEYVCRDVTRYREECSWVPSSTQCRTEYERDCRTETRWENECRPGSSERVCTRRPDVTVCENRPDREVCSERTGERICSTIPGGQDCKTVEGGEDCSYQQGPDVCSQVPRTETECREIPRERCETVPGRNDCREEPYSENVCGTETVYYPQEYACMKTETYYESYACMKKETVMLPFEKVLNVEIGVAIATNNITEEFVLKILSTPLNTELTKFMLSAKLPVDPSVLVVQKQRQLKLVSEDAKEIKVSGVLELELVKVDTQNIVFPSKVSHVLYTDNSAILDVAFKGKRPVRGEVELEVKRKDGTVVQRFKSAYPSDRVKLAKVDGKEGLRIQLNDYIRDPSRVKLTLKLSVPVLQVTGEILNAKKPESSRLYENIGLDVQ